HPKLPGQPFVIHSDFYEKRARPFVSIFLILVSFSFAAGRALSFAAGRALDEDQKKTFKIRGVLLCRNGEPVNKNKIIEVVERVHSNGFYTWVFDRKVTVSEGGHFALDVPLFKAPDGERIKKIIFHIEGGFHCSEHEFDDAYFQIQDEKDQDVGEIKLEDVPEEDEPNGLHNKAL
uniref:Uncharacterized protein n=1 Tax=Romanomermis culicivorax TaxID=13658 RepID=A0A915JJ84_ROMCU